MITAKEAKTLTEKSKQSNNTKEEQSILLQMNNIMYLIGDQVISGQTGPVEIYAMLPEVRRKLEILGFSLFDLPSYKITWIRW